MAAVCDGFDYYRSCYRNARRSSLNHIYQCDLYGTSDCEPGDGDSDQEDDSDADGEE
jgi:hypothetical protein